MTYGTGFETPEYAEDDAPRPDPSGCTIPGHQWRTNRQSGDEYCYTCYRELRIREGSWKEPGTSASQPRAANPTQFDDGEILEGVSITRAEAQALIEYHHTAPKMRLDRVAFDPAKVDAELDAIRGHFTRAENLRRALYPNSPARPVAAPVPEPPPQRRPDLRVRTVPVLPDDPPPVEVPPVFLPDSPPGGWIPAPMPPAEVETEPPPRPECKLPDCSLPPVDDDGWCHKHDPGLPPEVIPNRT